MNDIFVVRLINCDDKFGIIDIEDRDKVTNQNWIAQDKHIFSTKTRGHLRRKWTGLHHVIFGRHTLVDHINRFAFDNRKNNLRKATYAQNNVNRCKNLNPTSSKYKGVNWRKDKKKWRARCHYKGVEVSLGLFNIEIEAAKAYNNFAFKHYGEFALLNKIEN